MPKSENKSSEIPYCPNCYKKINVIKIGHRRTKSDVFQRYKCKTCNKTFTERPLKHVTYPPKIIFTAISAYNRGHTKRETASILSRNYRIDVPVQTIHSWLRRYKSICTFTNLRQKYSLDPKTVIRSKKLHHVQIYNFKYHRLKLNLAAKKFPELKHYINGIFDHCPNELFRKDSPRCSSLRIDIKPRKVTKYNNAPKLAEYALNLAKTNKERHEKVQDFMLINDSATIATELPVFLHPSELTKKQKKTYGIKLPDTLTGHIDILQVRFNQIHVLDYKPDAKFSDRKAAEQVFLYTLAFNKRINVPLQNFTCAYFDESNYYQFKPVVN